MRHTANRLALARAPIDSRPCYRQRAARVAATAAIARGVGQLRVRELRAARVLLVAGLQGAEGVVGQRGSDLSAAWAVQAIAFGLVRSREMHDRDRLASGLV